MAPAFTAPGLPLPAWTSRKVIRTAAKTVPNASGDWNGVHWPAVSDHLPLVAEMRLTEQ